MSQTASDATDSTDSEEQTDDGATYSFEAIVSIDVLDRFFEFVEAAGVNECRVHLNDGGIWTMAVDPANVAMIDCSLYASAFESYESPESPESVIGVNIERLQDMLGVANSGDLVELGLNAETRKLDLSIPNAGVEFELALIDPGAIRQDPDIPELGLPAEIVFEAAWLQRAVDVADMVSDHVAVSSDVDDSPNLSLSADGDTDSGTTRLGPEDIINGSVTDDAESIYSVDYLKPMSKVFDSDDELTLRLGEEMPLKIGFEYADGAGEGTFIVAPRIQNQ
jgi:proliferating cell nuclear antigen